jgi:hypothetical protein
MELLLGVLLGFPVLALLGLAVYAYLNAPAYGMNPYKWALISFFVPLFGFFAYLFERSERTPDSGRDEMFVDGPFEIHKSRADDAPFVSDPDEPPAEQDSNGGRDERGADRNMATDRSNGDPREP